MLEAPRIDNFAWLAWQGTFTSWALDPTRVSPVAHAVRDAHLLAVEPCVFDTLDARSDAIGSLVRESTGKLGWRGDCP